MNKTGTVHIVDKKSGKVLIGQKLARAISTEHARQKRQQNVWSCMHVAA